jgi:hypothetical protein
MNSMTSKSSTSVSASSTNTSDNEISAMPVTLNLGIRQSRWGLGDPDARCRTHTQVLGGDVLTVLLGGTRVTVHGRPLVGCPSPIIDFAAGRTRLTARLTRLSTPVGKNAAALTIHHGQCATRLGR